MIRFETYGEITFIRMARAVLGRPLYWTGAYLVDGLLLDCGPPATARELVRLTADRALHGLVLTHHHEDHVGAAPLLAAQRGLAPACMRPASPCSNTASGRSRTGGWSGAARPASGRARWGAR